MRWTCFVLLLLLLGSCESDNFNTVERIVDGNTVQLDNGVSVSLAGVAKNDENIPILKRYLSGSVVLLDARHHRIEDFNSAHISALIYNANGEQLNQMLAKVTKITEKRVVINAPAKTDEQTVVKLVKEDGVLKIPAEINGTAMFFIFDTGASLISLSAKEAERLYSQSNLTNGDFIGKSQFQDANGGMTEGTIVNLRTVKIGDRELHDVQAVINNNQNAPLLFGQSAMQKFGKVSIDYNRNEITFQ
jgi:aspartyl protease family protein